uniref:Peptidase C39-like protein n=1 Tax=Salinispora arenicola (strain CNS-205) TaxID=391037 RepID=A8M7D7_SALAI
MTHGNGGPALTTDKTSSNWAGGTAQLTGSWCFAAAEVTAQRGFGNNSISQEQVAHEVLMARADAGDYTQHSREYSEGVRLLWATNSRNDTSWASVHDLVNGNPTLRGYLENSWGQPRLSGRTTVMSGRIQSDVIKQTLDRDGLVLTGNALHWKVIYGYQEWSDNSLSYRVYDPMHDTTSILDEASVLQDMQVSIQVTA